MSWGPTSEFDSHIWIHSPVNKKELQSVYETTITNNIYHLIQEAFSPTGDLQRGQFVLNHHDCYMYHII